MGIGDWAQSPIPILKNPKDKKYYLYIEINLNLYYIK